MVCHDYAHSYHFIKRHSGYLVHIFKDLIQTTFFNDSFISIYFKDISQMYENYTKYDTNKVYKDYYVLIILNLL